MLFWPLTMKLLWVVVPLKCADPSCVEIKRMFVIEPYRQRGIAQSILSELETWVASLGF